MYNIRNRQSSRSHAIFTVIVERSEKDEFGGSLVTIGKLNLVDLAGELQLQEEVAVASKPSVTSVQEVLRGQASDVLFSKFLCVRNASEPSPGCDEASKKVNLEELRLPPSQSQSQSPPPRQSTTEGGVAQGGGAGSTGDVVKSHPLLSHLAIIR